MISADRFHLYKVLVNEGMEALVELVRKTGHIKLGSRADAEIVQAAAKDLGYKFELSRCEDGDYFVIDSEYQKNKKQLRGEMTT